MKNEKNTLAAGIELLVDNAPLQSCTCQYCCNPMGESQKLVVCSKCQTPHHEACYAENKRCTTYACKNSKPIPARFENGRIAVDARYYACAETVYKALDKIMRKACFMSIPADIYSLLRDEGLVSVISEKEHAVLESEVSMAHHVREQAAKYQREIRRMEQRRFWKDLFSFGFFRYFKVHIEIRIDRDFQVHLDDARITREKKADELDTKLAIMHDGLQSKRAELWRLNALKHDLEPYTSTGTGYVKLTDAGARMLKRMDDLRHSLQAPYADFVQRMT